MTDKHNLTRQILLCSKLIASIRSVLLLFKYEPLIVMPAKAGIQIILNEQNACDTYPGNSGVMSITHAGFTPVYHGKTSIRSLVNFWIPACAGMTKWKPPVIKV